jgi:hypothetical protein
LRLTRVVRLFDGTAQQAITAGRDELDHTAIIEAQHHHHRRLARAPRPGDYSADALAHDLVPELTTAHWLIHMTSPCFRVFLHFSAMETRGFLKT